MELSEFFAAHPKLALGFSGGTDSAYLLYEAVQNGVDIRPYYVQTQFQPKFELDDARRLCDQLDVQLCVIEIDVLADEQVRANPADRCYWCKSRLFGTLLERARLDGYTEIMDGTNASDDAGDRPGMRALKEMRVLSPLRLCGITKAEVRARSKAAGLFTHDKPAYACLATRIPTGTAIDAETLRKVERAEGALMDMGYRDFRVRVTAAGAKLQLKPEQMEKLLAERERVYALLQPDFGSVMLDLKAR